MGRLIDADELKKAVDVACSTGYIIPTEYIIDAVPTAYDLDEVVEQIEAEIESSDKYISEYDDSKVQKAYNKGMRKCLEIVKGGIK